MSELVQPRPADDLLREEPQAAELMHRMAADRVEPRRRSGSRRTAPATRPQQRRDIERRLVEGELLGVVGTDALELGIDIGLLDCAISVGFPGTVASLRQQWGRAGRRGPRARRARRVGGRARPVLHARAGDAARAARRGGDPRPREPARARRSRRGGGVRGADRRRRPRDARRRGARARAARPRAPAHEARLGLGGQGLSRGPHAAALCERRLVHRSSTRRRAPCSASSSASARTRPCTRAPSICTWASRGSCGSSTSSARRAVVEPHTGDWYTQVKKETDTDDRGAASRRAPRCGLQLTFGRVSVTEQVVAYQRRASATRRRSRRRARPAADDLRHGGRLVRADRAPSSTGSRRCRRCSRRSTPPSTR